MISEGNCGLGSNQQPTRRPTGDLIDQLKDMIAAAHNCGLTVAADYLAEVVRRAEDRMRQETPR